MKNYDWIQWYSFICFALTIIVLCFDAETKVRTYQDRVVNLLFGLPWIGRLLGWW